MFVAWTLLIFTTSDPFKVHEMCDLIEINHYHNEWGFLDFTQMIFWTWSEKDKTYHVRDWRFIKDGHNMTIKEHKASFDQAVKASLESISDIHRQEDFLKAVKYNGLFFGGPSYPTKRGKYHVTRFKEDSVWYEIKAPSFVQTYTQHDREIADRDDWPVPMRRTIFKKH